MFPLDSCVNLIFFILVSVVFCYYLLCSKFLE